jgi:hypothetical protein
MQIKIDDIGIKNIEGDISNVYKDIKMATETLTMSIAILK